MISIKNDDFSNNYELFVKLCAMTSEPLKLVNQNSQDMTVMTAEAFDRRRKMLDLREKLLGSEVDDMLNAKSEDFSRLGNIINELEKNEE